MYKSKGCPHPNRCFQEASLLLANISPKFDPFDDIHLFGENCHAPSWLNPGELSHMHIHLTMDRDLTQLNTLPHVVGGILVHCKTCLQVPDSRVQAWSQQSCLRRDKIQYFGKVLQNSLLTSHKMQLNRAILTMILPFP